MRIDVARVVPTGATDTEPARAFLQDRIGLWARWVFTLSFGFYLINLLIDAVLRGTSVGLANTFLEVGTLDHLAASLVFASLWVLTRRVALSLQSLRILDVAALFVGCTLFAAMGAYLMLELVAEGSEPALGAYAGLLACANTVMSRAIIVPSTPRRTLIVSSAAMAPLVLAILLAIPGYVDVVQIVQVVSWCAVSIAVATVGSRTIFGLRTEAARVKRLGQYTLEHKIGAGGMGVVYRASHAMLRRPTAIKLLPPDRAGQASLVRFEREVQMTAQLSHPNTVAVYDYGRTPEGVFYYAMEYLDGINLEELVADYGAQPAGRVVAILDQVCGALAEAHELGLVHRDIKPANIILTERGGEADVAKVLDFGLVKPVASDAAGVTMSASAVLTGTPLYMSPEAMVAPDSSDPRSDLYALGAVAYYLLTGQPVFEAESVAEIVGHHLHTEPVTPSLRTNQPIPADLEAVVMQCLRKTPEQRPASARALRDALRRSVVEPWTSEDASAWWQRFRAKKRTSEEREIQPDQALTVDVDVAERLTQTLAQRA